MTMLLGKTDAYDKVDESRLSMTGRLQKMLLNWLAYKNHLHHNWGKFCNQDPAAHHVPYRVWLRHSAYLEINRDSSANYDLD